MKTESVAMPFLQVIQDYAHDLLRGLSTFVRRSTPRIERLYSRGLPDSAPWLHFSSDPEIESLDHERRSRIASSDLDGEAQALAGIGNRLLKTVTHDRSVLAGCLREIDAVHKKTAGACTISLLRLSGVGARLRQEIDQAPTNSKTSNFAYAHAALADAIRRPYDPAAFAIAGGRYMESGQYEIARDCFARFDALGGTDNGKSSVLLGQCFLHLDQYLDASGAFERAVKQGYPALAVSALQARALLEIGDAQGALEQAELALGKSDFSAQAEEGDKHVSRATRLSSNVSIEMLLVAARACECLQDYSGMLKHIQNALRLDYDSEDARYWKIRAELRGTTPLESPSLDERLGQTELRWKRLFAAVTLHRNPTPNAVAEIVGIFKGADGKLDKQERQLFLALARRAMVPSLSVSADLMSKRREICEQIRAVHEPVGWITTNIAIDLLVRQNQYALAWNELTKDECAAEELGRQLAEVAAVLVAQRLGTPKGSPCVEAVRRGLLMLCATRSEGAVSAKADIERDLATHLDDSLVGVIPGLRRVVTGLLVLSKAISRTANVAEQLTEILCDPASPQWLNWLALRVRFLHGERSIADLHEVNHFALAWTVEQWWFLFGTAIKRPPAIVTRSGQWLGLTEVSKKIGSIRTARAGDGDAPEAISLSFGDRWNLGDLGIVCDRELELEVAFLQARRMLSDGLTDESVRQFETLLHQLPSLSLSTSQWWNPVLVYWHGVALLRSDKRQASIILAGLTTGGPKSSEARAQLALMAIADNSLEAAESLLSSVTPTFPAGAYAHSLVHARRGDIPQARVILESFDSDFAPGRSPYRVAAQRLLAALAERSGNLVVAERIHENIIASRPGDPVSCARLGRLVVKNAYAATRRGAALPSRDTLGTLLQAASTPLEWCRSYRFLWELLSLPEQTLAQAGADITAYEKSRVTAATWSQIIVWRLLRARRSEDAAKFLSAYGTRSGPAWYERVRLVLRASLLLKNVWMPDVEGMPREVGVDVNPDILTCVGEIDAELTREPNPALQRFRLLLTQATSVLKRQDSSLPPNLWQDLAPWPVANLPGLFSSSEQERAAAVGAVAQIIDKPDLGWSDAQRWLLRALAASACRQDEAYLDAYTTLESALEELPVDGTALWLEAASIWFRRKDWSSLLEGQLPSMVETLSNPNVRLLIGLAYARAAADDANSDNVRRASERARQAHSTLKGLFEV